MADAKKPEAEATVAPPKNKRKLILFVVVGAAVALIGGGGAYFLLKPSSKAASEEHGQNGSAEETAVRRPDHLAAPPAYYKFDKPFTVRLQSEQQDAYLQTQVQLKLETTEDQDLIKQFEPELKHRLTLTLMGKQAAELGTAVGVQNLANELRDVANQVVGVPPKRKSVPGREAVAADMADPGAPVQSVLFSTFIVQ